MKFFIDTEFIARRGSLELISIGVVSDRGNKFYAETSEYDISHFEQWHYENVYGSLKFLDAEKSDIIQDRDGVTEVYGSYKYIGEKLKNWINNIQVSDPIRPLEFWGWFCQTDWVLFCWLFGDSLVDLPYMWPQYCNDIIQAADGNTPKYRLYS